MITNTSIACGTGEDNPVIIMIINTSIACGTGEDNPADDQGPQGPLQSLVHSACGHWPAAGVLQQVAVLFVCDQGQDGGAQESQQPPDAHHHLKPTGLRQTMTDTQRQRPARSQDVIKK